MHTWLTLYFYLLQCLLPNYADCDLSNFNYVRHLQISAVFFLSLKVLCSSDSVLYTHFPVNITILELLECCYVMFIGELIDFG